MSNVPSAGDRHGYHGVIAQAAEMRESMSASVPSGELEMRQSAVPDVPVAATRNRQRWPSRPSLRACPRPLLWQELSVANAMLAPAAPLPATIQGFR